MMSDETTTPVAKGVIAKAVTSIATAEAKQQMPRLWVWWAVAAGLAGLVALIAPQQIGNVLMKTLLVFMAGITSYFLDRAFFLLVPYKLDENLPQDVVGASRIVARALIFLGCVMGYELGI